MKLNKPMRMKDFKDQIREFVKHLKGKGLDEYVVIDNKFYGRPLKVGYAGLCKLFIPCDADIGFNVIALQTRLHQCDHILNYCVPGISSVDQLPVVSKKSLIRERK